MSAETSLGLPYPQLTDNVDPPGDIQALAQATDDLLQLLVNPPLTRLAAQATQSLTNGILTALAFGTGSEDVDTHGFHSETVNNTRVTPTVPGWYALTGLLVMISPSSAFTQVLVAFRKNGTTLDSQVTLRPDVGATASTGVPGFTEASCNGAGDYFEMAGQQNNGGGVAVTTRADTNLKSFFTVRYLRPL